MFSINTSFYDDFVKKNNNFSLNPVYKDPEDLIAKSSYERLIDEYHQALSMAKQTRSHGKFVQTVAPYYFNDLNSKTFVLILHDFWLGGDTFQSCRFIRSYSDLSMDNENGYTFTINSDIDIFCKNNRELLELPKHDPKMIHFIFIDPNSHKLRNFQYMGLTESFETLVPFEIEESIVETKIKAALGLGNLLKKENKSDHFDIQNLYPEDGFS